MWKIRNDLLSLVFINVPRIVPFKESYIKNPESSLKRKIRKRVRNQSAFLKHTIVYFTLFSIFIVAAFIIRDREFVLPFLLMFSMWMIGLIFHWLSAFVFNRIDSWEEAQYQKRIIDLNLQDDTEEMEKTLDLKPYDKPSTRSETRWDEEDFV